MDPLTIVLSVFIFTALYFQVFFLVTYFENRAGFFCFNFKKEKIDFTNLPSVTIIVPCWNEEKTVTETLKSLLSLQYPKDKLFIFVINDGSIDNTADKIKPFILDERVKYFYKENGGKHTALNLGIKFAKTDLVGCLDADSFVSKTALLSMVEEFKNPEIMAVTPGIKVNKPKTIIQQIQETEYMVSLILRKLLSFLNAQYVAPGPFSIYRRSVFDFVGNFKNAHNAEDMEMAMRMKMHKMKIGNAFNAEVYTNTPATLKILIKQRLRWTYGFIRNAFDYRFMFFRRKYGNIGMLSMPAAFISLIAVLYMIFYIIHGLYFFLQEKITYLLIVGWNPSFGFDWFFINTGIITLLSYFSLMIFLGFLSLSIYHVRGGFIFKKSDLYYIVLYGFIAPLWILRTAIQLILKHPVHWK